MKEKSIFIEGVGNISLVKSRRARRISISVRPFEAVKVTLPWYTTMFEANLLIQQKMDWLKKSRARMTRYEQQHTVFTPETIFSTRFHKLVIKKHEKKTLRISI
ncbi:MAG: YgjP-like metallopeptidase domain-containing protein, partial [Bacteroidota bacterium]